MNKNLEESMLDALVDFKDKRQIPSQDEFIENVTSDVQIEISEDDAMKIAEFYHMHFE